MTNLIRPPARRRRSQLSTPGSSEKMMAKAAASNADHVFLDLEDAVAPNRKASARGMICEALNTLDWSGKVRCVRINDLTTEYYYQDLEEVISGAGDNLDTIMLTKVKSAQDIHHVEAILTDLERRHGLKRRIGLEALIEEVEGLINVDEIARASDRMECLIFGMGDFSASMGVDVESIGRSDGYPGDIWHYARFRLTLACRAAGIDPVDGPYADFQDHSGYQEEARRAMVLGMVGKWAIHPSQIELALDTFTPTPDAIDRARKLAAAYSEAEKQGLGAVTVDGVMVDAASIRILRNTVLRKADLYEL